MFQTDGAHIYDTATGLLYYHDEYHNVVVESVVSGRCTTIAYAGSQAVKFWKWLQSNCE